MKNLMMAALVAILGTNTVAQSQMMPGNDKGNGGFLFSRTSKKLLDEAQKSLQIELTELLNKRSDSTYISQQCSRPIEMQKLKILIDEMTYSYETRTYAINPEGKREERFFQINQRRKVEADRLYFETFVDSYFRYVEAEDAIAKQKVLAPVRLAIVHEGLHEFGYDELSARTCVEDLTAAIESYSDLKLKMLQSQVKAENVQLVKNYLIESGCFTEKQAQKVQAMTASLNLGGDYSEMIGRQVLSCMSKNQILKKQDRMMSLEQLISGMGKAVYTAKSVEALAVYISSTYELPFEKEIPHQK